MDLWTLALQAINVLILVALLKHWLFRPVMAAIDSRRQALAAARAAVEAEQAAVETERGRLQAATERLNGSRDQVLAEAHAQAETLHRERMAQAQREAKAVVDEARQALERERAQALRELREQAAATADTLAQRLLLAVADKSITLALMTRAADALAQLPEAERRGLLDSLAGQPLPVRSAHALDEDDLQAYGRRLGAILAAPVTLLAQTDEALLAGVALCFPHGELRHNWRDALSDARREALADDDAD